MYHLIADSLKPTDLRSSTLRDDELLFTDVEFSNDGRLYHLQFIHNPSYTKIFLSFNGHKNYSPNVANFQNIAARIRGSNSPQPLETLVVGGHMACMELGNVNQKELAEILEDPIFENPAVRVVYIGNSFDAQTSGLPVDRVTIGRVYWH